MRDVLLINVLHQSGGVMIRFFHVLIAAALYSDLPVDFGVVRPYAPHVHNNRSMFDPHSFWDFEWLGIEARKLRGSASEAEVARCRSLAPCFAKAAVDLEMRLGRLPKDLLETAGCQEGRDERFSRLTSSPFKVSGLGPLHVASFALTGTDVVCRMPVEMEVMCDAGAEMDDADASARIYDFIRRSWAVKPHIASLLDGLGTRPEDVLYFHLRRVEGTDIVLTQAEAPDIPIVLSAMNLTSAAKALTDLLRLYDLKCVFVSARDSWASAPPVLELLGLMSGRLCNISWPFGPAQIEGNLFRMEFARRAGVLLTVPFTTWSDFAIARRCVVRDPCSKLRHSLVMRNNEVAADNATQLVVKFVSCLDGAGKEAIVKYKGGSCVEDMTRREPNSVTIWRNSGVCDHLEQFGERPLGRKSQCYDFDRLFSKERLKRLKNAKRRKRPQHG